MTVRQVSDPCLNEEVQWRVRNTFIECFSPMPSLRRNRSFPGALSLCDVATTEASSTREDAGSVVDVAITPLAAVSDSKVDMQLSMTSQKEPKKPKKSKIINQNTEDITTLMFCDIPCKVGYERMMVELKALGLDGEYDYLHLPTKVSRKDKYSFLGFGFINFKSAVVAEQFRQIFTSFRFEGISSEKLGRVEVARVQGREANLKMLSNAARRSNYPLFIADPLGIRAEEYLARLPSLESPR
eukprot:TRINITY_DN9468_c0_g2_i1.p1 TRINITY_DN9468_c0_g2~~TRINITY_DN9468_c0_g2_i1.p1  ORF type:complete len:242 (-),score=41.44 TRINITY_DN9468_c0_g2_i1:263-988(-)